MSSPGPGEVTELLRHWSEPEIRGRLFDIIYPELRQIAAFRMSRERRDHTLQPTALVNELFLRMASQNDLLWRNREHFLAIASSAMRRLLIDYARATGAAKRGGALEWLPLHGEIPSAAPGIEHLLQLDELLSLFAAQDPRAARVVELRCFGGLTFEEIADLLKIHHRTAKRDWLLAIAWFHSSLAAPASPEAA